MSVDRTPRNAMNEPAHARIVAHLPASAALAAAGTCAALAFRRVAGGDGFPPVLPGVLLFAFLLLAALLLARRAASRAAEGGRSRTRGEIGALAAGLAHEIRNPLNTIRFNLKMLAEDLPADGAGGEGGAALVAATAAEASRLERLLTSYLEFARPERAPEPREVRLERVAGECLDFLGEEFAAAGVALLPDADPGLPPVRTDPEILRRALHNVLRNAREAMDGPGAIRVEIRRAGERQAVVVEDEGPGVPPELAERIFEPFFTTKGTGTGLGLAIAREAVASLGGTIRCERGKRGARFVIEL